MSAIVGPNGAGKSSVLDAIGFAMAIRHKKYGDENVENLISYGADQNEPMFVELVCSTLNDNNVYLRRTFDAESEASDFTVNKRRVTKKEYRKLIQNSRLDLMVSSFWLSQSKVLSKFEFFEFFQSVF